jgi:hypothetical protein
MGDTRNLFRIEEGFAGRSTRDQPGHGNGITANVEDAAASRLISKQAMFRLVGAHAEAE